jgi:hypothetical protein
MAKRRAALAAQRPVSRDAPVAGERTTAATSDHRSRRLVSSTPTALRCLPNDSRWPPPQEAINNDGCANQCALDQKTHRQCIQCFANQCGENR